jgi:RNA polymerase sigma-70 factor (ECF subfamily)
LPGPPGPYALQAAIAALHARAARAEDTDWAQIARLYQGLMACAPSPVVELNAAVAYGMAHGIDDALRWIEHIEARGELRAYHLLPAARAELLRRLGREAEAATAYRQALALARNGAEIRYLGERLAGLAGHQAMP